MNHNKMPAEEALRRGSDRSQPGPALARVLQPM